MAYNIIYRGHCDYTGNYWHMGECIRAWFYYDEEKEEYWVKAENGNRKGMITHLNYQRWEDILEDWIVPKNVQVESWYGDGKDRHEVGSCILEQICGAQLIILNDKPGAQIRGYKDGIFDEAFVFV